MKTAQKRFNSTLTATYMYSFISSGIYHMKLTCSTSLFLKFILSILYTVTCHCQNILETPFSSSKAWRRTWERATGWIWTCSANRYCIKTRKFTLILLTGSLRDWNRHTIGADELLIQHELGNHNSISVTVRLSFGSRSFLEGVDINVIKCNMSSCIARLLIYRFSKSWSNALCFMR